LAEVDWKRKTENNPVFYSVMSSSFRASGEGIQMAWLELGNVFITPASSL